MRRNPWELKFDFSDKGDYPVSSLGSPPARTISDYLVVVTITASGSG